MATWVLGSQTHWRSCFFSLSLDTITETQDTMSNSPAPVPPPPAFLKLLTLLSYSSATNIAMSDILVRIPLSLCDVLCLKGCCFAFCLTKAIYRKSQPTVFWIRMRVNLLLLLFAAGGFGSSVFSIHFLWVGHLVSIFLLLGLANQSL